MTALTLQDGLEIVVPSHLPRPALNHADSDDLTGPATGSINYVRPLTLGTLIEYAVRRVRRPAPDATATEPPGPPRLEPEVKAVLTRKLRRDEDPSWSVHAIYGAYLPTLYWLDQQWLESRLDRVFPTGDEDSERWRFAVAWGSYVGVNPSRVHRPLFEAVRGKYLRALENLQAGYVTRSYQMPVRNLAIHLTEEYLWSDYDIRSEEGQESLIARFFQAASPEERGSPAWWLWRIGEQNQSRFHASWSRVRALWEWRARKASESNHTTDFDDEMRYFAHLPSVAPQCETLRSLWPLLEGVLLHVSRSQYRDIGWHSLEGYLAAEVERDARRAMQFYRLMHDQLPRPRRWYPAEARTILEAAVANSDSRDDALALIDTIYRWGDPQFLDIAEPYLR